MKLKRTYSFGAGLGLLLIADLGTAGGIPAMHWGGMELQTSVNHCIGRARKAFSEAGVRNTQIGGWQAYGQKTDAVLVSCAAMSNGRSYLTVVGTSNDSREAELSCGTMYGVGSQEWSSLTIERKLSNINRSAVLIRPVAVNKVIARAALL